MAFDWLNGDQIWTVHNAFPKCQHSVDDCTGRAYPTRMAALANGTILLQVEFETKQDEQWVELRSLDTGAATCSTEDPLAHATFPKNVTVPVSMASACSSTVVGSCHAPYAGDMNAQCCWDPVAWTTYWNQTTASNDSCGVPSVTCPVRNDSLHATFPHGYTVEKIVGSCTALVEGVCNPSYRGVVAASCCWDPLDSNASGVWKMQDGAAANCSKIASCPTSSEALHAVFLAGTTVPEAEHACIAADGECSSGYVGSIRAECCWTTTYNGQEWFNRSVWTNPSGGGCKPEWRIPTIIGAVALCSLAVGFWVNVAVCRYRLGPSSSNTGSSSRYQTVEPSSTEGAQSSRIYEGV